MLSGRFLRVMVIIDLVLVAVSLVWGGYAAVQGEWEVVAGQVVHLL